MNYKCKIIIPYFGQFQNSIIPFLKSCENNPEFEWLFVTDAAFPCAVPLNVHVQRTTLNALKQRIEKKIGFSISLEAPYKICDFRPAFGFIFEEELKGFDFWGWGDVDLVYGKLSNFITDEILDRFDKIYPCGHLSMIKNTEENNKAFMENIRGTLDYHKVFKSPNSMIFDEYKGLNETFLATGRKVYGKIDFADMDIVYTRFRTADWKTIRKVFPDFLFKQFIPKNYRNQIFFVNNGNAYRIYVEHGRIEYQELVYIHYRKKIDCANDIDYNKGFYITKNGILQDESELDKNLITKYNYYPGKLFEFKEYLCFYKERMVMKLGSNILLRNMVRKIKGKDIIQ